MPTASPGGSPPSQAGSAPPRRPRLPELAPRQAYALQKERAAGWRDKVREAGRAAAGAPTWAQAFLTQFIIGVNGRGAEAKGGLPQQLLLLQPRRHCQCQLFPPPLHANQRLLVDVETPLSIFAFPHSRPPHPPPQTQSAPVLCPSPSGLGTAAPAATPARHKVARHWAPHVGPASGRRCRRSRRGRGVAAPPTPAPRPWPAPPLAAPPLGPSLCPPCTPIVLASL